MNAIETTHALGFEAAPYPSFFEDEKWNRYRVGTIEGLWNFDESNYLILSFVNSEPGNGHLDDVLEWFEYSAKRDGKSLKILSTYNARFYRHLIAKRGFKPVKGKDYDLIKTFI